MIRSRKDEGTSVSTITSSATAASPMGISTKHDSTSTLTAGAAVLTSTNATSSNINSSTSQSAAAYRFQQQRTSSNISASASPSKASVTTPTTKRSMSSVTAIGFSIGREDTASATSAPSATSVSSFTNTSSTSVSSSLQYYNNLLQHQMYNVRKNRFKKKSKHHNNSSDATSIWTVQMPKRMLFSTMGIFLLLPLLLFVYKELHIQSIDQKELRGKKYNGLSSSAGMTIVMKKTNRNQEYVTWMADHLAGGKAEDNEDEEDQFSTSTDLINDIDGNETIQEIPNDNVVNNNTIESLVDDLIRHNAEEDTIQKRSVEMSNGESEKLARNANDVIEDTENMERR